MSETSNMLLIIVYSFGWFWKLEKKSRRPLPNRPCIFASKLFCWRVPPYKAQSMKWKVPCIAHFTVRLLFFCIYLYMGKIRTMLVHSKEHSESLNPIDINFELPKIVIEQGLSLTIGCQECCNSSCHRTDAQSTSPDLLTTADDTSVLGYCKTAYLYSTYT